MRTIIVCLFLFIAISSFAQRECAHASYLEQQKLSDPDFATRSIVIESFVQQANAAHTFTSSDARGEGVIRIPVVIHILYNNASQNLSDAQVKSQIDALNRDFRRKNGDTSNIPARFKGLAADVQIEFVLATADPKGRATTGIIRKYTTVTNWNLDDKIKFSAQGGSDAWDSRSYLNIWVGAMRSNLGYSSSPGADAAKDGVVINPSVFGTINVAAPFHLGRTATHEVGHWLGLKHIWGDTYCGDDLVDDTPKQGGFTTGCPTGFRTSCNNGETGDMYMNYMDYTNDACMNLFTTGQMNRMRSMFNASGPRASLLQSKGLNAPWVEEAPVDPVQPSVDFNLYPDPASAEINLIFDETWIGKQFQIVNSNGVVLQTVSIKSKKQTTSIQSLGPGLYFVQAQNEDKKIRTKFIKL